MRISDWSSDVCSSDLRPGAQADRGAAAGDQGAVPAAAGGAAPAGHVRMRPGLRNTCRSGFSRGLLKGVAAFRGKLVAEAAPARRSEEHTSELQSLMRISYAVFCLKKKKTKNHTYKQRP